VLKPVKEEKLIKQIKDHKTRRTRIGGATMDATTWGSETGPPRTKRSSEGGVEQKNGHVLEEGPEEDLKTSKALTFFSRDCLKGRPKRSLVKWSSSPKKRGEGRTGTRGQKFKGSGTRSEFVGYAKSQTGEEKNGMLKTVTKKIKRSQFQPADSLQDEDVTSQRRGNEKELRKA